MLPQDVADKSAAVERPALEVKELFLYEHARVGPCHFHRPR
jgi:hypothetical protein